MKTPDSSNNITSISQVTEEDVSREFHNEATTSMRNIKPGSMAEHFSEWVDRDLAMLDESRREQLKQYALTHGGRIKFHLFRLLSDERRASHVENDFGLGFLDYSDEYFSELKKQDNKMLETLQEDDPYNSMEDKVFSVLSSESLDAAMFWTFAPYIYKHLKLKGISDSECVKKIMQWAATGDVGTSQDNSPSRRINLKGVKELGLWDSYYLTKNPKGATHLFTDREAKKIVDNIFMQEEK